MTVRQVQRPRGPDGARRRRGLLHDPGGPGRSRYRGPGDAAAGDDQLDRIRAFGSGLAWLRLSHPGFPGTPREHSEEGPLAWVEIARMMTLPMWEGDRLFLPLVRWRRAPVPRLHALREQPAERLDLHARLRPSPLPACRRPATIAADGTTRRTHRVNHHGPSPWLEPGPRGGRTRHRAPSVVLTCRKRVLARFRTEPDPVHVDNGSLGRGGTSPSPPAEPVECGGALEPLDSGEEPASEHLTRRKQE